MLGATDRGHLPRNWMHCAYRSHASSHVHLYTAVLLGQTPGCLAKPTDPSLHYYFFEQDMAIMSPLVICCLHASLTQRPRLVAFPV
jgi:hypothetical protein